MKCLTICCVAALWLAAGLAQAQNSFTEDFTAYDFRSNSTSADWDTTAGELKFFPFEVNLQGSLDTAGEARGAELCGGLLYLADGYDGLKIIDISGSGSPSIVGAYDTPGHASEVHVQGGHAYVNDNSGGLQIIDVSDPTAPVGVGSYATADHSLSLAVDGDFAYVCFGTGGFHVVDVSNPTAPALAHAMTTGWVTARAVEVDGDLAYVANGFAGLRILDISDPYAPSEIGSAVGSSYLSAVAARGDYVFTSSSGGGLDVFDVTSPTAPVLVGTYPYLSTLHDVFVFGNTAYLAAHDRGVVAIDVTDPSSPTELWTYDTAGLTYGVFADANQMFVGDDSAGLAILETAEPFAPDQVDVAYMGLVAYKITLDDNLAAVAASSNGFRLYDITDRTSPTFRATVNPVGYVDEVAVAGNHVFAAASSDGLLIYDITDPTAPVQVGQYNPSASIDVVAVQGNRAYVGGSGNTVEVIDIYDPALPGQIGSVTASGFMRDLQVTGDRVWAANGNQLTAIDVSDPFSPAIEGLYDFGFRAWKLELDGQRAFVGTDEGIRILDIANPGAITLVRAIADSISISDFCLDGDQLIYRSDTAEITVLDIDNLYSPKEIAVLSTYGTAYDLATDGGVLYAGFDNSYLRIYDIYQAEVRGDDRWGHSLSFDGESYGVVAARLTDWSGTGISTISLRNSVWNGYEPVPALDEWLHFDGVSSSLSWLAELSYDPDYTSIISNLTFEWLNEFPRISAVTDIPNDQGRQVRVQWRRSGYDFLGHENQIVEYAVYREFDDSAKDIGRLVLNPGVARQSAQIEQNAEVMLAAGWDYVTSVPVLVQDDYAVVVPTLADSTIAEGLALSTFQVVGLTATPGQVYVSPAVSGYSVDNLAPNVPSGITATYQADGVDLDWLDAEDEDLRYWRIYRSEDPSFTPAPEFLVGQVAASAWTDLSSDPWAYHYQITAVDFAGNESTVGQPTQASGTDQPQAAQRFALHGAAPNPFNPSTSVSFSLDRSGSVTLAVYDISGRLVRTLLQEELEQGRHEVRWDGRNGGGQLVASGVYLCRLSDGTRTSQQHMMMLK